MMDFEQKISKLEVDMASLKERLYFLTNVHERLETTLDKIETMIETRREGVKEDVKDLYDKVHSVEKEIMCEIDSVRKDIKALEEEQGHKIDSLEKWRWLVIGGAAVIAWIITKIAGILTHTG